MSERFIYVDYSRGFNAAVFIVKRILYSFCKVFVLVRCVGFYNESC